VSNGPTGDTSYKYSIKTTGVTINTSEKVTVVSYGTHYFYPQYTHPSSGYTLKANDTVLKITSSAITAEYKAFFVNASEVRIWYGTKNITNEISSGDITLTLWYEQ
jgi:hypothetical protein